MLPTPYPFLTNLLSQLEPKPGALNHLHIDHICYRVATVSDYQELKIRLLADNDLLAESIIKGRFISTFRMAVPFRFGDRDIWLLELPEPKASSPYSEGWEHAEFVTDRPLPEFEQWLISRLGINASEIDRSGLDKPLNADLRLRLKDGLSVKFHELALEEVIRLENQ